MTERDAIAKAIEALERDADTAETLETLRDLLTWHHVEKRGSNHLSTPTIRLRSYIEKAIVELERGYKSDGLHTLRHAIKTGE